MTKFCRYHRDYGHDTEDCWQLRCEIEQLIRQGRLDRFRGTLAAGPIVVVPPEP